MTALQQTTARLRQWIQPPATAAFPVSHAALMGLAAVVGLYGGLAAGLFANFIALFQILFFQPGLLRHAADASTEKWQTAFLHRLEAAPWHWEYLIIAAGAVITGQVIARLAERRHRWLPSVEQTEVIRSIGWLIGFGLVLYYPLLVLTTFNRLEGVGRGTFFIDMVESVPWEWRLLGPCVGGLIVGLLLRHVTPESEGHGVVEVIESIKVQGRHIPARVAVWKAVVSGLTIGSGGSAGREGPVVQMGAAVSSGLASRFGLTRDQTRVLLACGGAAGIAASFNSPIGGTLFALEIILGDFQMSSIAPIAFAAVSATVTGRTLMGAEGELVHIAFQVASAIEIVPYVVLGVLSAVVAVLYVRSVHGVEHAFVHGPRLSRVPREFRPMIGGLAVGAIGVFVPRVLGIGYGTMNFALEGKLGAGLLLIVLICKIAATGLTLGSGAPGGSFFPAIFMGAVLGGAVGTLGHGLAPTLIAGPSAYAAVGMAAVVAGATQAPLTAILMLFELTSSYEIILPLMVACTTSVAGAYWWLGGSMYSLKLRAKGIPLEEPRTDSLQRTRVGDVMTSRVVTISPSASFAQILRVVRETGHSAFPMVDEQGHLRGLLLVEQLRTFLGSDEDLRPTVAADFALLNSPFALPSESLEEVRRRMLAARLSHLPVVDETNHEVLVGILSNRDILMAFEAGTREALLKPPPAPH